jgi:hypothetical protein
MGNQWVILNFSALPLRVPPNPLKCLFDIERHLPLFLPYLVVQSFSSLPISWLSHEKVAAATGATEVKPW